MHFAHLANSLLKDEESARGNHAVACNFAKYLPIIYRMACFADISVPQGSVATYARCGGLFNIHISTNLPRNLAVKTFLNRFLNQFRFDRIVAMSLWPYFFWPTLWVTWPWLHPLGGKLVITRHTLHKTESFTKWKWKFEYLALAVPEIFRGCKILKCVTWSWPRPFQGFIIGRLGLTVLINLQ